MYCHGIDRFIHSFKVLENNTKRDLVFIFYVTDSNTLYLLCTRQSPEQPFASACFKDCPRDLASEFYPQTGNE